MTPVHVTKNERSYDYYVCTTAQCRGWKHCLSRSVPAASIENLVGEQLRIPLEDRDLFHTPEQLPQLLPGLVRRVHQVGAHSRIAVQHDLEASKTCPRSALQANSIIGELRK